MKGVKNSIEQQAFECISDDIHDILEMTKKGVLQIERIAIALEAQANLYKLLCELQQREIVRRIHAEEEMKEGFNKMFNSVNPNEPELPFKKDGQY